MPDIPKTMKALVVHQFGQSLVTEVPVPAFGPDEVLLKIRGIAICGSDPHLVAGEWVNRNHWPPHLPFIFGHEWSGEVAAVGAGVTDLKVGDRVAGEGHCGCGQCENCKKGDYTICLNYGKQELGHRHYGHINPGANAQYGVFRAKALTKMPDTLDSIAGTMCDTVGVALHALELTGVTVGGTVTVIGPGPVGLCVLSLAKNMGAYRVVVVGRGHRLKTAGELGADVLVDFEKGDVPARIRELTDGKGADEVIECSGAPTGPRLAIDCTRKGGTVGLIGQYHESKAEPMSLAKIVNEQIRIIGSKANPNVAAKVLRLLDKGVVDWKRLITHRFPMERYNEGIDLFVNRRDNVVKVVIEPWS